MKGSSKSPSSVCFADSFPPGGSLALHLHYTTSPLSLHYKKTPLSLYTSHKNYILLDLLLIKDYNGSGAICSEIVNIFIQVKGEIIYESRTRT